MQKSSPTQSIKKRIYWIDVCRGIAIIFVLYGHLFVSDKNNYLIFAFHMPLFFFISGLVFKPIYEKPMKWILVKYFKQLLIPYYIFAVMTYIFASISGTTDLSIKGIGYQLFGIVYGSGSDGMLGYNVVLWFLPCLFITKLLFVSLLRRVSQTRSILLALFGSAMLGASLSLFAPWIKFPFGCEIALTALPFLGIGYILRKERPLFAKFKTYKLPIATASILLTILIATFNYHISGIKVDLRSNHLGIIPLFYLSAFSGIIGWTAVSYIIKKNAFLEYIGRHSMVLFAWHNILIVDLKNMVDSIINQDWLNAIPLMIPTLYASMAISIILFSRMLLLKLKSAYHVVFS
jgi:acyltransferase